MINGRIHVWIEKDTYLQKEYISHHNNILHYNYIVYLQFKWDIPFQ